MKQSLLELKEQLFEAILQARQRVYAVGEVTPLMALPIKGMPCQVWAKREDLGPIKAYKWRGAFNAMAALSEEQRNLGVVAASAGNHAQGIALAASHLGCKATIFMPRATPEVKQYAVRRHGGDWVEIRLVGDCYDDAATAARAFCDEQKAIYIHPYDDIQVMAGQGTLADEIIMSGEGPFTHVYIAIGGGGLASATSLWLKRHWPSVKIIGVEGVDQASMKAAVKAGAPVALEYVDVFCDGTAVRKVGENTSRICADLVDEFVTATNDEVCSAIRVMWDGLRAIPEPSGALPLAALINDVHAKKIGPNDRPLVIICGANMDFSQLAQISRRAGIGSHEQRYLRIPIEDSPGKLLGLLQQLPKNVSVTEVQYGRADTNTQYPVLGLTGTEADFDQIDALLAKAQLQCEDVSNSEDVAYRIINYDPSLFEYPLFVSIEFPERPGAFTEFMAEIQAWANLCYFNYAYSGERVGRALVGMEFRSLEDQAACLQRIREISGRTIRAWKMVEPEVLKRISGGLF